MKMTVTFMESNMETSMTFMESNMETSMTLMESNMEMSLDFVESNSQFNISFGEIHQIEVPTLPDTNNVYDGEYTVIPSVEEQTLNTAQKFMKNNLTITKIPYHVTGNNSGGNTVYIAKEIGING